MLCTCTVQSAEMHSGVGMAELLETGDKGKR